MCSLLVVTVMGDIWIVSKPPEINQNYERKPQKKHRHEFCLEFHQTDNSSATATKQGRFRGSCCPAVVLDIEKRAACNSPSHSQVFVCFFLALPTCYYFFLFHIWNLWAWTRPLMWVPALLHLLSSLTFSPVWPELSLSFLDISLPQKKKKKNSF